MGWTATEERLAHDRGVKGGRTSYNSNVGCCYPLSSTEKMLHFFGCANNVIYLWSTLISK